MITELAAALESHPKTCQPHLWQSCQQFRHIFKWSKCFSLFFREKKNPCNIIERNRHMSLHDFSKNMIFLLKCGAILWLCLLSQEICDSMCVNTHLRGLPLWWLRPPAELLIAFVCELHQSCVYNRFSLLLASLSAWVLAKYDGWPSY